MTITEVSKIYGLSADTLRYYERIGMIPPVTRTASGIRNYTEEDCKWIEFAKCMRGAGLPIEIMIEYLKLFQQGDETIPARRDLLVEQQAKLLEQRQSIDTMLDRLTYKVNRYDEAVKTGTLSWEDPT